LIPKILRAFPPIWPALERPCQTAGSFRTGHVKLVEFLGEDVDGELNPKKIRRETIHNPKYIAPAAALSINFNSRIQEERTDIMWTISCVL